MNQKGKMSVMSYLTQLWNEKSEAAAAFEDAVRREYANGRSARDIAREFGSEDRPKIMAILNRDSAGMPVTQSPGLAPVVWYSGAGRSDRAHEEFRTGCWARGWLTVNAEVDAFHLARGGHPVVRAVFSRRDVADGQQDIYVALLRAVYRPHPDDGDPVRISDLVTTAGYGHLMRENPTLLDTEIIPEREQRFVLEPLEEITKFEPKRYDRDQMNKIGEYGAHVLDAPRIVRWVADVLGQD